MHASHLETLVKAGRLHEQYVYGFDCHGWSTVRTVAALMLLRMLVAVLVLMMVSMMFMIMMMMAVPMTTIRGMTTVAASCDQKTVHHKC